MFKRVRENSLKPIWPGGGLAGFAGQEVPLADLSNRTANHLSGYGRQAGPEPYANARIDGALCFNVFEGGGVRIPNKETHSGSPKGGEEGPNHEGSVTHLVLGGVDPPSLSKNPFSASLRVAIIL